MTTPATMERPQLGRSVLTTADLALLCLAEISHLRPATPWADVASSLNRRPSPVAWTATKVANAARRLVAAGLADANVLRKLRRAEGARPLEEAR